MQLEEEAPFVNLYVPTNNFDGAAKIDLDIRTVWSKVSLGDTESIDAAREVYSGGRGSQSDVTLESIGTSSELLDPNVIKEYSGSYDYGDRLMQAVFNKVSTSFENSGIDFDFDFDFSVFSNDGNVGAYFSRLLDLFVFLLLLNEIIMVFLFYLLKGFVRRGILGIVMDYINFCLYQATKSCHNLDLSQSIMHWDEAVAFYTGSIPRESGAEGYLFYTESEVQGSKFGTRSGSMSMSNKAAFDNSHEGKMKLKENECGLAEVNAEKIKSQMLIPLIQGLLRTSYQIDYLSYQNEITRGEAAGYAAALLPSINNCSKFKASFIMRWLLGELISTAFE